MPEGSPTISIIVPTLNEAKNIRLVLPALPEVHEVILVDGHSVDGTIEAAQSVRPGIKVLHQTRRGKGNALVCGFAAATGDIVVMFDADGSADPAEIPAFVGALTDGADYAKGSRFCRTGTPGSEDISPLRLLGNGGLNKVANLLFGTRFTDLCYGYNAFWRRILPLLDLPPVSSPVRDPHQLLWGDGFEIETVLSCRVAAAQLRVAEVPSFERRRIFGDTNLRTFADGARVLRTILVERLSAARQKFGTTVATDLDARLVSAVDVVQSSVAMVNAVGLPATPSAPLRPTIRTSARIANHARSLPGARSYVSGVWRSGSGRRETPDDS